MDQLRAFCTLVAAVTMLVGCGADEEPVRQGTPLARVCSQPWSQSVTPPQHPFVSVCGDHNRLPLPTGAAHPDLTEIAARAALLHVELASALGVPPMHEEIPVDITQVPARTGANEPHRHHLPFPAILINKHSSFLEGPADRDIAQRVSGANKAIPILSAYKEGYQWVIR